MRDAGDLRALPRDAHVRTLLAPERDGREVAPLCAHLGEQRARVESAAQEQRRDAWLRALPDRRRPEPAELLSHLGHIPHVAAHATEAPVAMPFDRRRRDAPQARRWEQLDPAPPRALAEHVIEAQELRDR